MPFSGGNKVKGGGARALYLLLFLAVIVVKIREFNCSFIENIMELVKEQRNRLKPYEERKPKLDCKDSVSPFKKRQLYWYYKNLVAQKELKKIWKESKEFSAENITDSDIFSSEFLLPTGSGIIKFGKFLDSNKEVVKGTENLTLDYSTPLLYNSTQLKQRLSGLVLDGAIRKEKEIEIDEIGRVLDRNETGIRSSESRGGKSNTFDKGNYIWGTLVSPCDGQVQFNLILGYSFQYEENVSLYIIYCDSGGVRERYSKFRGKVTEFLNGRHRENCLGEGEYDVCSKGVAGENRSGFSFRRERNSESRSALAIDLGKRYVVKRGDVLMKIIEYYNPPMFEEDLTIIPIFMPCEGTVAWDKKQKHIFTKGERILEFKCNDEDKIRQLISPGRGYTEFVDESDKGVMNLIEKIRSKGFSGGWLRNEEGSDSEANPSAKTLPIGHLISLMKLEVKYGRQKDDNTSCESGRELILIKMPCVGKIEYPLLRSNFILKDEVLYVARCQDSETKIMVETNNVQGIVELLVENEQVVKKNVYILRVIPKSLSEIDLNTAGEFPNYRNDLYLSNTDPINHLYMEANTQA
ncbi:hypothetical protein FG386_003298 [Cryptosporidium ryanae]|uniref:uncharacterized protein n=1 Tax=Cryptosporidium ryanae TaxID=515981 RepID=UPI00351A35F2|nr:hypothetical protein FG386_003298 [Cryptosporidium ryanae]